MGISTEVFFCSQDTLGGNCLGQDLSIVFFPDLHTGVGG